MTAGLPPGSRPPLYPHVIRPDPDAPDDLGPLPDGMYQEPYFTEIVQIVRTIFAIEPAVLVSGDTPIYYDDEEGRQRIVRPDCYVAFDVDTVAIMRRNGYFMRLVGKPPGFAPEITSVSTYTEDLARKRDLYARVGIGEYWRFDPTGGGFYGEPLAGEVLVDGVYRRLELRRDDEGRVWGSSPALGMDLCWDDGRLRFYDPARGEFRRNLAESEDAYEFERAAREEAEARAADAEDALQAERARIRQLEEELRRRDE